MFVDMLMGDIADETQVVKVAKALADATRFSIYQAIAARVELSCGDIARLFPVSQATVSHHVRILKESGLVNVRREGQFSYLHAERARLDWFRQALQRCTTCPQPSAE